MPFIDQDQAAALQSSTVRLATLVELQFVSQTMRLFTGHGTLDVAGVAWQGVGDFGSIDNLAQSRTPTSEKVTLRLSGVSPEVLALATGAQSDVAGQPCYIWLQLFDADWQTIGARIPVFWATMQRLRIVRTPADDQGHGGERSCELELENPFAARSRPSVGRWTDADQQARHPDDKFFEFMPSQQGISFIWPDF